MALSNFAFALALAVAGLISTSTLTQTGPNCPRSDLGEAQLSVMARPENSLIVDAAVTLTQPAPIYVEYGNDQAGWLRTPTAPASLDQHLPLVRLRPSADYLARAIALDGDGCQTLVAEQSFRAGQLPAPLQKLSINATGRASFPLALMDIRLADARAAGDDVRWFVAFDQDWQPVWYYAIPADFLQGAPAGRGANALIQLTNGDLLYLGKSFGFEELTPDTRVQQRTRLPNSLVHHDLIELPDGRIMFLGQVGRTIDFRPIGGPAQLKVFGDTLNVFDPRTGLAERIWNAFDALNPLARTPEHLDWTAGDVEEWTHGNAIFLGQRGNVLISFRHLNQVISLAPDWKTIEWKLGGPDSSFSFPDSSDRFWAQHSVSELPNGHILLFDNGNFRPEGEFSRGLELELDFESMTARKVWEYRDSIDTYAWSQSNIVRLSNDNTLVSYGTADGPDEPVLLVEARPDGSAAWEMSLRLSGLRPSRYRTYPLYSLAGEAPVDPPGR